MPDWTANTRAINWAPYSNEGEASFCLTQFINKVLSPDIGIIWCSTDACALIRKATPDADGFSYTVVMDWHPVLPPPPPPPKPSLWQKVEKIFWDEMEQEGEREVAYGQANLAFGQAVVDFFGSKDGEHITGLAFDVLGVVCFIALFIPGVGEAELGFVAAIKAGQMALTAGRVTAGLAVAGTMLAARVDGTYVLLRYRDGEEAARNWEESPEATKESIAAAILALPDFLVGGAMLARDLATLPGRIGTAGQEAARARNQIAGADQYVKKIETKHGGAVPPGSRDSKKIAANTARAERLADLAKEANLRSQQLSNKLYVAMLANAPSTFIGTPVGEAYFNHDDPHFWPDHLGWVGNLLTPPSSHATRPPPGNFSAKIGVSGQTPSGN
jgi:hypothetical protein